MSRIKGLYEAVIVEGGPRTVSNRFFGNLIINSTGPVAVSIRPRRAWAPGAAGNPAGKRRA